jgi:hypothetical protein
MVYNQQTNNQDSERGSLPASRTFNGPVHNYVEHVTGEGSFVACAQVTITCVGPGHNKFSGTAVVSGQTTSGKHSPKEPSLFA